MDADIGEQVSAMVWNSSFSLQLDERKPISDNNTPPTVPAITNILAWPLHGRLVPWSDVGAGPTHPHSQPCLALLQPCGQICPPLHESVNVAVNAINKITARALNGYSNSCVRKTLGPLSILESLEELVATLWEKVSSSCCTIMYSSDFFFFTKDKGSHGKAPGKWGYLRPVQGCP